MPENVLYSHARWYARVFHVQNRVRLRNFLRFLKNFYGTETARDRSLAESGLVFRAWDPRVGPMNQERFFQFLRHLPQYAQYVKF